MSSIPTVALATDADGDSFPATQDCDDTQAGINANSQEVIADQTDQDCDHQDTINRRLTVTSFPTPSWAGAGGVNRTGDKVVLGTGMLAGSVTNSGLTTPLPNGTVHLIMNVDNLTGTCSAKVTTTKGGSSTVATETISSTGTYVSGALSAQTALGIFPARTLSKIELICTAGNSMTVDWLSIQNTDDIYPPSSEVSVTWKDVEAPGGGLSTTVVRTGASFTSYAGSDLGGVARWSDWDEGWTTINGEGATGLTSQAALGVWDILAVTGALYVLTGRPTGGDLAGGLWKSGDDGLTWAEVGTSHDKQAGVQVGGYGRYSACGGTAYAGGKLLEGEPSNPDLVYIANGDEDNPGLALYDASEADPDLDVCTFPAGSSGLPTDGRVRSIARVEGATYGTPMLLVGYQGVSDSLWLCELPEASGVVSLECGGTSATCTEVTDFTSLDLLDVRDIETDPIDPSRVYLADGGETTTADGDYCSVGAGSLYTFYVDDAGSSVSVEELQEIPNAFDFADSDQELTGLSVDPESDFLFAFVPKTPDGVYEKDRMYRISTVDAIAGASTGDWQAVNTDSGDEGTRAANIVNGTDDVSWLFNGGSGKVDPYPARWAPGQSIDGIWLDWPGDLDFAILASTFSLWGVYGLDDTTAGWDPEADTDWYFGPPADTTNDRTFQEVVVKDIAADSLGNIWMPSADLGLLELESGASAAARDCIWEGVIAGGAEVSIGMDDSVWVAMYDQDDESDYPHQMGIFRTTDYGASWAYQGAGQSGLRFATQLDSYQCKDADTTHLAAPFEGTSTATSPANGADFNGGSIDDEAWSTWGNPIHIAAINEYAALATFKSWGPIDSHSMDGRLALTLDGGKTWVSVTFDGTGAGAGYTCNSSDFFDLPKSISLIKLGASTYANDIDASGTIGFGEWAADFMIAGKYEDATSSTKNCSVARVRLWGNTTSPSYDWDWFPLDKDASSPTCDVDEENILGVVASPWSDEAWVFGSYVHFPENGRGAGTPQQSFGGACTLDITDNSVAATRLVDPATHRYTIADIAPNPYITDSLLVVPQVDAAVWFECNEYAVSGTPPSLGCADVPAPFILERPVSTWSEVTFGALPPSLIGTAGAWAPIGANGPTILYATEGASAWQGVMSW